MEGYDLILFAKAFSSMGSAVQEQLENIMDGDYDSVNPNAINAAKRAIYRYNDEDINEAIDNYFAWLDEQNEK